jgi:thiamine transport system ATP-binding protein
MLDLSGCRFAQGEFSLAADWCLPRGARLAVIGPSGSGKSTLLAGIAGFCPAVSGGVFWDGQRLPQDPRLRPMVMLFQDHNLFPHLTVAQNVGLGLRPSLRLSAAERDRVREALAAVGLDGLEARYPATLSGGQQGRVALARITVMDRPVILLDEPFSALGPGQRAEMLHLVRALAAEREAVLVMVTHDLADARALDGDVCYVEEGRAAAPVPMAEFLRDPPAHVRAYFGDRD